MDLFSRSIHYPLVQYCFALIGSLALYYFLKRVRQHLVLRSNDYLRSVLSNIRNEVIFVVAIFLASQFVPVPDQIRLLLRGLLVCAVVYQFLLVGGDAISQILVSKVLAGDREDPSRKNAIKNIATILRVFMWISAVLFLLSNVGFNVSSVVAGLGIGGIAIALATQSVLGDTFSSFVIFFDKPFEVGDLIEVGVVTGTVERIGLKTTRIRSLQGELVVMANSQLTSACLKNFKVMSRRRATASLGVEYQTSLKQLTKIPILLEQAVKSTEMVTFVRAHFVRFASSSLDFELVYEVESADYLAFMDAQQNVNFNIVRAFEAEKIHFAFPTQTLHVSAPASFPLSGENI